MPHIYKTAYGDNSQNLSKIQQNEYTLTVLK